MTSAFIPVALGAFGLLVAFFVYQWIKKSPVGSGPEKDIADEIHLGAMVFMASEYKRLAVFCLICIIALYASLGRYRYSICAGSTVFGNSWLHRHVHCYESKC